MKLLHKILTILAISANIALAYHNTVPVDQAKIIFDTLYNENPNIGFQISDEESALVIEAGGAPTYGEITWDSAVTLLNDPDLNLQESDIFYDLGSGVGKLCIMAYLISPVTKSIGIELAECRFIEAEKAKKSLKKSITASLKKKLRGKKIIFRKNNILTAPFEDATVIYMCSTCYEPMMKPLMERFAQLPNGVRIISLKALPEHPDIQQIKELTLPMTWKPAGTLVHIYKIEHPNP